MVIQTGFPGIVKDRLDSEPRICGTRFTVSRIVRDLSDCMQDERKLEKGIEEWLSLFPGYPKGYIDKEKIHCAFEYYKRNREEIDNYIARSKRNSGKVLRTGQPLRHYG